MRFNLSKPVGLTDEDVVRLMLDWDAPCLNPTPPALPESYLITAQSCGVQTGTRARPAPREQDCWKKWCL